MKRQKQMMPIYESSLYCKYLCDGAKTLTGVIALLREWAREMRDLDATGVGLREGVNYGWAHFFTLDPTVAAQFEFERSDEDVEAGYAGYFPRSSTDVLETGRQISEQAAPSRDYEADGYTERVCVDHEILMKTFLDGCESPAEMATDMEAFAQRLSDLKAAGVRLILARDGALHLRPSLKVAKKLDFVELIHTDDLDGEDDASV